MIFSVMQNLKKSQKKIIYEQHAQSPTPSAANNKTTLGFDSFRLTICTRNDSIILNFHEYIVTFMLHFRGACGAPLFMDSFVSVT